MSVDFLFRLDANSGVGAGHFMRCLGLMERLVEQGFSIGLQGCVDERYLTPFKALGGQFFSIEEPVNARCMIIDHYDELDRLLQEWPDDRPVVLFEDLAERSHSKINVVINVVGNADDLFVRFPNAQVFTGISHVFFRKELTVLKAAALQKREGVVVSLGGSPQAEVMSYTICLLQRLLPHQKIHIYGNVSGSEAFQNVEVIGFSEHFLTHARSASLVISASGQSLLELAFLQVPVIGIVVADNQRESGKFLANQGMNIALSVDELEAELGRVVATNMRQPGNQLIAAQAEVLFQQIVALLV